MGMPNPALIGTVGHASAASATTGAGNSTGGSGTVAYITVAFGTGVTISSISDNKSNTYTLIGSVLTGTGKLARYKCENFTGGAGHTATVTLSGSDFPTISLVEISGVLASSPQDSAASNTNTGSQSSPFAISNNSLAQVAEVLICGFEINNGAGDGAYAANANCTLLGQESLRSTYWTHGVFYRVNTSGTAAVSSSVTSSGATTPQTLACFIDAFKLESSIGGRGFRRRYSKKRPGPNMDKLQLSGWFPQMKLRRWFLRSWRDASGPATYTLNASPGSYSITGASAALKAARVLNASPGSYSITGGPANLSHGYVLNTVAGSYAISGAAASLIVARVLKAAAGSYAISGASANLLATHVLNAAAGGYTITGANALILAGRALLAAPGNYAISGASAQLIATHFLNAAAGAYAIDGKDATFSYDTGGGPGPAPSFDGKYMLDSIGRMMR